MGKKKKGGKGKKEKSEDGLPPPPNLDNYREGAQEALLTFKLARSNWIRYLIKRGVQCDIVSCAVLCCLCDVGFRARRSRYCSTRKMLRSSRIETAGRKRRLVAVATWLE